MIDWLIIELWIYVPLDTKYVMSETFHKPIWYGETKPTCNITKARIRQSQEMY